MKRRYATSFGSIWSHFHAECNHQGLDNQLIAPEGEVGGQAGRVMRRKRLGGLLSYYRRTDKMIPRKVRSVNKALTEEERVRHRTIREQVEQEKSEPMARGRRPKARHTMLKEAVGALKATREALGLSLADIKAYTGIEKSNLSRLENDPHSNPTIDTLCRYADAVGKEIVITLVDKSSENG